MKPDWKQFLIDRGAELSGDHLNHFGNPARERRIPPQGAILCDLSHIGLISVDGDDAGTFLQGQLSSDVNQVNEQHTQYSAYNSPKGRAITTFQVMQRQGHYYLSLSQDLLEPVLKKLRIFVMRSQVVLKDATDSLVHFGYADPQGEQRLQDILGTFPKKPMESLQHNDLTIIRKPASVPRFEILGELDAARHLWEQLGVHAAGVARESWDYFEIESGTPHVNLASTESWVPQMLNLDLLDAVSFSKGCYPGQEVVARLKYLGKNKRRLYHISSESVDIPNTGTPVTTADGTEVGEILNAAPNPDSYMQALAVLKTDSIQQPLSVNGQRIQLLALPYSLEVEEAKK